MQTLSSKELLTKQERAKELKKREANNHVKINQMTQAEAINSAGNQ
jgi:hypothetical protein